MQRRAHDPKVGGSNPPQTPPVPLMSVIGHHSSRSALYDCVVPLQSRRSKRKKKILFATNTERGRRRGLHSDNLTSQETFSPGEKLDATARP
jgi:hypothetical protein